MTRRKVTDSNGGDGKYPDKWHVNRGVPVAFIISMLLYAIVQSALFGWYSSAIDKRVEAVEKAQVMMAPQGERITRVEEKLISIDKGVTRIEALLTKPR
jgi:hypothetical protein